MKKIVIIGNSAAGFAAAKTLAENKGDFEITVISRSNYSCYKKGLLIDYLGGKIQEKELFLAPDKYYQDNSIKLLKNSEAVRIDVRRQNVVLKDKSRISYDFLIIASGERIKLPDIPGKAKEGVVTANSLEDVNKIKDLLLIASTICVIGQGDLSLRLGQVLADKSKEVKIIGAANSPEALNEKIELINDAVVREVIGESKEAQALKLNSGKAIGTNLIIFFGNPIAESDFLKDLDFQLENGYIVVDDNLFTGKENIFACGSVAKKAAMPPMRKSWDEAVNEGVLVAQNIIHILKEQENLACQKP